MPKGVYERTEWHKSRIKGTFKKGHTPWHKSTFKKGHIPWNKGKKLSKETKIKLSLIKREKHHRWKGGKFERQGYIFILKPEHPLCIQIGYIRRSHLVMEKHLGRYLKPEEVVHHINGIKDDDRIENLQLFANKSKHSYYHHPKGSTWGKNS